jgi:hypothetical protein
MYIGLGLKKDISLTWALKAYVAPHLGPEVGDFATPSMQIPILYCFVPKAYVLPLQKKKEIGVASCASSRWSASTAGSMPWPIASECLLACFSMSSVLDPIGNCRDADAPKWW